MEEPLCFVRDNPFVKADGGCRRLLRRGVAPAPPKPLRHLSPAAATTAPSTEQRVEMGADSEGLQLSPASPDIEYGPGIVEKLKAKFSKLSSGLTKETRSRRIPSVDELNSHDYEPIRHMEAPMLAKRHSKSTNDIYEQEEPRTYHIHRVVAMDQDEDSIDAPCISTLRRKFETSAERSSRLRPVSTDLSQVRDFSLHTSSLTYDAPPPRGLRLVGADPIVVVSRNNNNNNNVTSPLMSPLPVASPLLSPVPVTVAAPVKETVVEQTTRRLRVLEVLNQAESEPEFVKIGRRLRKSAAPPPDLFENSDERRNVEFQTEVIEKPEVPAPDYEPHYDHYEPPRVERPVVMETPMTTTTIIETPKAPPPRNFIIRGEAHLPTISGNFRVIRETSSQSFELPPDPEPAKHSTSTVTVTSPPVVHHYQPPPIAAPQGSPPPEEPRPSRPVEPEVVVPQQQPCALCENSQPQLTVPVVVAKPETTTTAGAKIDGEGISEVQRLLSRFQMSRSSRGVFEVPQEEMRTLSSSTLVNMRSVEQTPAPPRPATGAGRVNVVSISVRSDAPSVITTSQNSTDGVSPVSTPTPSKRMAPSPPEESLSPPVIETQPPLLSKPSVAVVVEEQRKSLSSQYLEEKARRERPYGDDVTELRTEPRESSVDDDEEEEQVAPVPVVAPPTSLIQDSESSASEDSESEEHFYSPMPARPFTLSFSEPMFAGDGNPVRHTLLSLVMEEDIPMLMEAMQEKHNFVFEDLHEKPSTSSIIHPLETRKLRRQQRQVSRIQFREEAPQVYTYLDEMTAEASEQWHEGALLDYDAYQRMLELEQEELDQSLSELARWRQGVGRSWEDAASQNGLIHSAVNSFNSLPDPNTICPRAPAVA